MDQKESNVANTTEQFFVYVDRGRSRPIKNTVRSTASQKYFLKEHHYGILGLNDINPPVHHERRKLLIERRQQRFL